MASQQFVDTFFAWAPLTAFVVIAAAAFLMTRREHATVPSAAVKTYSCAQCGRRGKRDHMVPVTREGAVVWYCARCAH